MKKQNSNQFDQLYSPSLGRLLFGAAVKRISQYISKAAESEYRVVVGTDSTPSNGAGAEFVTAVIVHHVGAGGIYFWTKSNNFDRFATIRERIYQEALLSLEMAEKLVGEFEKIGLLEHNLEIHVDVGNNGPTREMIAEVVGMIRGNGFEVKTKPAAWGASTVADRHL